LLVPLPQVALARSPSSMRSRIHNSSVSTSSQRSQRAATGRTRRTGSSGAAEPRGRG
jgi:hypothetical protein